MRPLITKFTPSRGFSQLVHFGYNVFLPLLVLVLVKIDFAPLALSIIFLSKWRMLAVRPRFWLANIRANSIDIIIGISALAFMVSFHNEILQILWAVLWAGWLVFVKPGTSIFMVSTQAFIGLAAGLLSLFIAWDGGPLGGLVISAGAICFFAAHHFFDSFEEPYSRLLAYGWGYFGAALTWVLGHWLIFYGVVAQPALLLIALGSGVGALYYLDHFDRVNVNIRRQIIFIMVVVTLVVLTFSGWSDKIVSG